MKISKISALVLFVLMITEPAFSLTGPYLGQPSPGLEAQIFASGIISTNHEWVQYPMWSPDGLEFYYCYSSRNWNGGEGWHYIHGMDGHWTDPVSIMFDNPTPPGVPPCLTSLNWFMGPAFTANGQRIFLMAWDANGTTNIWMSERTESGWSEAVKLDIPIPANPWWISATNDGTIYLTDDGTALYRSCPDENGHYGSLVNIIGAVGISRFLCHQIAPDESYIILGQFDAPGGYGNYDLWISYRDDQDQWTRPQNLGSKINTNRAEIMPFITSDGKYLFYSTRGTNVSNSSSSDTNIYWIEARAVLPVSDGSIRNLSTDQRFGSIQCAINYANSGDTIVLQPGIYHENVTLNSKNIILRSVDPNSSFYIGGTTLNGDSANSPVITLQENSEVCEITGLTIRSGSIGIKGIETNVTIRNCRIMDNTNHGIELSQGSNPRLQHCLITSNGQTGINMLTGPGRSSPLCAPLIENCIIVQNDSANITGGAPSIINSIVSQ